MLESLEIKDFALIEQLTIDWSEGLNVLTGETGAGKSIIMDALNAVLGGKVGPSAIRAGADRSIIEATFEASPRVKAWLKEQQLLDDDSDALTVARDINRSGSKIRINGTLVNHALVQELGGQLLTVHAQHESRTLMTPQSQLEMLDGLGGADHRKLLDKVRTLHARRRDLSIELDDLKMSEQDRLRRLDFARFQLAELLEAKVRDTDEDEQLSAHCQKLANAAQLEDSIQSARKFLTAGGDGEGSISATDLIQKAVALIDRAERFDSELALLSELLRVSLSHVEEASTALRRYGDTLDSDPASLAAAETRLFELQNIRKKYGPTLKDALDLQDTLAAEIDNLESSDEKVRDLTLELDDLSGELEKSAAALSEKRRTLAAGLSKSVEKQLGELGMERCKFSIAFKESDEIGAHGLDRIEFTLAPNPGQPPQPLARIASGGELSRVMLAIKTIFAAADYVPTVIFDEIDTGMSGKVLQSMRDKLSALSRSHQILCITHQPIIASVADNHLAVRKRQTAQKTDVSVKPLKGEERLKQLAAMASGEANQQVALNFARSLVEQAEQVKGFKG